MVPLFGICLIPRSRVVKKLMVGCLVTGLLLLLVSGGAAYWFIWRPMQQAQQAEMNARPFIPDAQGLLTQDQVDQYMLVQQAMLAKLGTDFEIIKNKIKDKASQSKDQNTNIGMSDMLGAYQEFMAVRNNAKQARTESLHAQKMSMDEYQWIHTQVNSAMKVMAIGAIGDAQKTVGSGGVETAPAPATEDKAGDPAKEAFQKAIEAASVAIKEASKENGQDLGIPMSEAEISAAKQNAELLKPHQTELMKMMVLNLVDMDNPMALFGQ
jgi:hypothetical protein